MSLPFRLVLATRNAGKVAEMQALLERLPVVLSPASAFPEVPPVAEDLPTLAGNAGKKALVLHAYTGLPALADDTGLEVAVLGGAPGVHSARYAGPVADDAANRRRLLRDLAGREDRTAQFRTVVAFADHRGMRFFEGVCEGHILEEERGSGGFGYDALFVPAGEARTFAELDRDEKNAISHRGRALRRFAAYLRAYLAGAGRPGDVVSDV